jgi:hypothetical protein
MDVLPIVVIAAGHFRATPVLSGVAESKSPFVSFSFIQHAKKYSLTDAGAKCFNQRFCRSGDAVVPVAFKSKFCN